MGEAPTLLKPPLPVYWCLHHPESLFPNGLPHQWSCKIPCRGANLTTRQVCCLLGWYHEDFLSELVQIPSLISFFFWQSLAASYNHAHKCSHHVPNGPSTRRVSSWVFDPKIHSIIAEFLYYFVYLMLPPPKEHPNLTD